MITEHAASHGSTHHSHSRELDKIYIPSVLLAEDDPELRKLMVQALRQKSFDVVAVGDGISLLDYLVNPFLDRFWDLVISDVRLPHASGLEILEEMSKHEHVPQFILITAFGSQETHEMARSFGARIVMDKPFDIDDLLITAERLIYNSHSHR